MVANFTYLCTLGDWSCDPLSLYPFETGALDHSVIIIIIIIIIISSSSSSVIIIIIILLRVSPSNER